MSTRIRKGHIRMDRRYSYIMKGDIQVWNSIALQGGTFGTPSLLLPFAQKYSSICGHFLLFQLSRFWVRLQKSLAKLHLVSPLS